MNNRQESEQRHQTIPLQDTDPKKIDRYVQSQVDLLRPFPGAHKAARDLYAGVQDKSSGIDLFLEHKKNIHLQDQYCVALGIYYHYARLLFSFRQLTLPVLRKRPQPEDFRNIKDKTKQAEKYYQAEAVFERTRGAIAYLESEGEKFIPSFWLYIVPLDALPNIRSLMNRQSRSVRLFECFDTMIHQKQELITEEVYSELLQVILLAVRSERTSLGGVFMPPGEGDESKITQLMYFVARNGFLDLQSSEEREERQDAIPRGLTARFKDGKKIYTLISRVIKSALESLSEKGSTLQPAALALIKELNSVKFLEPSSYNAPESPFTRVVVKHLIQADYIHECNLQRYLSGVYQLAQEEQGRLRDFYKTFMEKLAECNYHIVFSAEDIGEILQPESDELTQDDINSFVQAVQNVNERQIDRIEVTDSDIGLSGEKSVTILEFDRDNTPNTMINIDHTIINNQDSNPSVLVLRYAIEVRPQAVYIDFRVNDPDNVTLTHHLAALTTVRKSIEYTLASAEKEDISDVRDDSTENDTLILDREARRAAKQAAYKASQAEMKKDLPPQPKKKVPSDTEQLVEHVEQEHLKTLPTRIMFSPQLHRTMQSVIDGKKGAQVIPFQDARAFAKSYNNLKPAEREKVNFIGFKIRGRGEQMGRIKVGYLRIILFLFKDEQTSELIGVVIEADKRFDDTYRPENVNNWIRDISAASEALSTKKKK